MCYGQTVVLKSYVLLLLVFLYHRKLTCFLLMPAAKGDFFVKRRRNHTVIMWHNWCTLAANLLHSVIWLRPNLSVLKFSFIWRELCPQTLVCSCHFVLAHAAGGVLCMQCYLFEVNYAPSAMQEDALTCFHHVYHASIQEKSFFFKLGLFLCLK